jgi:hypothetical protein
MFGQIAYEVSNRREVDAEHGLHVHLQLKWSGVTVSYDLLAYVALTDNVEMGNVVIARDQLGLGTHDAHMLARAACQAAWNAVVAGDCAAAGADWRFLDTWLCGHIGWEQGRPIYRRVEGRLSNLPQHAQKSSTDAQDHC